MKKLVTIVPGLVSLSTNITRLKDFALAENFSFFPPPSHPLPFHYTLEKSPSPAQPREWEYRVGYHSFAKGVLSYSRSFIWTKLSFVYDENKKHFAINSMYLKFPFRIGGIRTAGEHLFARIAFDLFQAGYMLCKGCAWRGEDGEVRTLILPSMNGKTTLLDGLLRAGTAVQYIAEDLVLFKPLASGYEIYPTAAFRKNYGRKANKQLARALTPSSLLSEPVRGQKIIFATTNTIPPEAGRQKVIDFTLITSLFFLHDPQVQLSLFAQGKTGELLESTGSRFAGLQTEVCFCSLEALRACCVND
jgi:hypothetical protein